MSDLRIVSEATKEELEAALAALDGPYIIEGWMI